MAEYGSECRSRNPPFQQNRIFYYSIYIPLDARARPDFSEDRARPKGGFSLLDDTQRQVPEESGSHAAKLLGQRIRDGSLREILRDWKWIFSFCRGKWGSIFLYTLCGIASSGITLVSGIAGKYLIDCIVTLDQTRLLPLAGIVAATSLVSVLFRSLTARYGARLSVAMRNDVQGQVFARLLRSDWMEIRQFSTGDLLSRFNTDLGTVASCASGWLPSVMIQSFTVLATLGVVLYYDPMMALIAFASTPVLLFASRRLMRKQRTYHKRMRQVGAGMSAFQAEVFRNVDTLKSFGTESDMVTTLEHWQTDFRDVTLEYNDFSIRTNLWLTAMGTAVQFLAMGYCLLRMWRGEILFGTMVLFLQQRAQLSSAFSTLISQIPTILSGSVAAERVRELTELEPEPRQGSDVSPTGKCRVEAHGVDVSYRDDGRVILRNVELTVEAGSVAALVGPSGEGKSTMMRLMLGLVRPDHGELFLVDENGEKLPLGADTRGYLAYVPQGNTVLSGTIAENLRLARPQATEEEMVTALRDACAWEFVEELPGGLYGRIGEGGKGLSEGQAQRIAIARALVRNAQVLLLDEVTSALDLDTEQRVLRNLIRRGVTCIAATHRPSILSLCSRVYRVRDGSVELLTAEEVQNLVSTASDL